jgi:uncharacterized protein (TIGR00251 family)
MSPWCRRAPDGAWILWVHAQPGARRTEVAGLHGDALKIRIAAPALEDRANEALMEFVAKRVGVAKRDVTLESGGKSRDKRLRVGGAGAIERLLEDPKSKA